MRNLQAFFGAASRCLTLLLAASSFAHAQTSPDAGALLRESERQPRALPQPGPQAVPQAPLQMPADGARVVVKGFRLTGNTLIPEAELQTVVQPWIGREAGLADLQQAANAIANEYRRRGWFVRPQLPAQDVSEGLIHIHILEGRLGAVRIDDGGKEMRLESRIVTETMTARQQPGDPLNLDHLERSSNILNDTPGVAAATILTAGSGPAETDALVKVQDKPLVAGTTQYDNTGARSTGEGKLTISLAFDNPTGIGDQISLNANGSDGSHYAKLGYSLPVGNDGLRVGASVSNMVYKLVGPDFEALKTKGDAQTFGLNASYPLLRTGTRNIALAGALDRKAYFNAANYAVTSEKRITSLLVSVTGDLLDGLGAGGMTLWGANLTHGVVDLSRHAGNQTTDRTGPRTEGRYTKWGANLARLQRLSDVITLWASVSTQGAGKNLDSSEKMSLGGPSAVRAYPLMEASGDEGWQGTVELRYNLTAELQVSAFYDHGRIRRDHDANYNGALTPGVAVLKGTGLSLAWNQPGKVSLRATLARRLGDNPVRTTATGKDQDGSFDINRLWLTGVLYF